MNGVVLTLFISVLIFAPLAFGTVEPWSLGLMETVSFFTLFLLLRRNAQKKDVSFLETPGLLPLLCLLALIGAQLVPLPCGIVEIISPETCRIYRETRFIDTPVSLVPLSVSPKATLSEFFRAASYIAFYVLTVQVLADRRILRKTVMVLVIFASILSVFAILQHLLPNNKIFWLRELTLGGKPFGPYVNRNHYAGLMEMLFPLALSLFLFFKPRTTRKSLRDRTAEIFAFQGTHTYILLGFSAVLIATSLFLTLSRSGIVSLCLSMVFFGALFLSRGADKSRGLIIVAIFLLVVLAVGWFGWTPIIERFERIRNASGDISDLRVQIWKDSWNIIRDFPIAGAGYGSFQNIYPKYRTLAGNPVVDHAHNDYLEILSEGGVLSLFFCGWFLIVLFWKSFRVFLKRRERYSIYLFCAAAAGMMSILIHGLTDFNLHIGANGLYFFFLAGLAVSAANTRFREGLGETYLKGASLPWRWAEALSGILLFGCLVFQTGVTSAELYYSSLKEVRLQEGTPRPELIRMRDMVSRAAFLDPLEAQYRFASANIERGLGNEIALQRYREAVRLNPVKGEYLEKLGLAESERGSNDLASKLLQAGIKYDVNNPDRYRRYAQWLFSMGRVEEGTGVARTAILLDPAKTKQYITIMVLNGFSDEEILRSLPERVQPHLAFADYLSGTGKELKAEEEYLRALRYVDREDVVRREHYYPVYRYYVKRQRFEEALEILQRAAVAFPHDAEIKLRMADVNEKLGNIAKAKEICRKVLLTDPGSREAKRRLDKLLKLKDH